MKGAVCWFILCNCMVFGHVSKIFLYFMKFELDETLDFHSGISEG